MRRLALPVLFALGFLAAGGLSATVVAATGTGTTSTSTDTTSTTTTGTTPTTTGTTTTGPSPTMIAPGVTVGGIPVGGMSGADAKTALLSVVNQPIAVKVGKRSFQSSPSRSRRRPADQGGDQARARGRAGQRIFRWRSP